MGSVQHPDVTLVKVLGCVTFPLYLSLLLCSSFLYIWAIGNLSCLPLSRDTVSPSYLDWRLNILLLHNQEAFSEVVRGEESWRFRTDIFIDAFQSMILNSLGEEGQRLPPHGMPTYVCAEHPSKHIAQGRNMLKCHQTAAWSSSYFKFSYEESRSKI